MCIVVAYCVCSLIDRWMVVYVSIYHYLYSTWMKIYVSSMLEKAYKLKRSLVLATRYRKAKQIKNEIQFTLNGNDIVFFNKKKHSIIWSGLSSWYLFGMRFLLKINSKMNMNLLELYAKLLHSYEFMFKFQCWCLRCFESNCKKKNH